MGHLTELVPQAFTHQLDMNAVFDHVALDGAPHVADSLGGFAIGAQPGFDAGILEPEVDVVDRYGIVLGPGDGRFQIGSHLVHAHHQDYLFGAEGHGCHPVAHAVEVDQFSVQGDGVGLVIMISAIIPWRRSSKPSSGDNSG